MEAFRAATTMTRVVHKEVVHSSVCASSQDLGSHFFFFFLSNKLFSAMVLVILHMHFAAVLG